MRFAKPDVIESRHRLLVAFIERKLEEARANERTVREAREKHVPDKLERLIAQECVRKYGYYESPIDHALWSATQDVQEWERVLDDCNRHPEITPDDALHGDWSDRPKPQIGVPSLESACWGALAECPKLSTAQLVGLAGLNEDQD